MCEFQILRNTTRTKVLNTKLANNAYGTIRDKT